MSVSEGGVRLWPPPGAATIVLASVGFVVFSGVGGASGADAGIKGETGVRWLLLVLGIAVVTFAVIGGLGYLLGLKLFAPALALLVLLPGLRHFPREFRRRVRNKPSPQVAPAEADPPSAG